MTVSDFRNVEKNGEEPLVSIISPCYNVEKYLPRFLDSVLAQSYPSIELILIDDCSTDQTYTIAESYRQSFSERGFGFRLIRCDENRGAAAAINRGLPLMEGSCLMWADADDILMAENVSEKVRYLQNNPDQDFVLCQMASVYEHDLDTPVKIWKREISGDHDPLVEDLLLARNVVYGPGTVLARRSAFEKAIPDKVIYESRQGQNYQLILPLAHCCKCGYLDQILVKYVIHSDSHSNLYRSYEEKIRRQNEFIILIRETLFRIPGMKADDHERYMKLAEQLLLNNELKADLEAGHLIHYYRTRIKMKKEDIQISRNLKPLFYYGRYIKRKLSEKKKR